MAKIVEGGGEEPVFEITPEQLAFIQEIKGEKATLAPGVTGGGLKEATILSSLVSAWTEFKERVLNPSDPDGFDVGRPNCSFPLLPFSVELIISGATITGLPFLGFPPALNPKMKLDLFFPYAGLPGFPVHFPSQQISLTSNPASWDGVKWVFAPGGNLIYSTLAFADPTYQNINYPISYCLGAVDITPYGGGGGTYSVNNVRLKVNWLFWDPPGSPDITFSCTTVPRPAPPDELALFSWKASKYIYGTPGKPDCFGEFNNFLFTNRYP